MYERVESSAWGSKSLIIQRNLIQKVCTTQATADKIQDES